MKKLLILAAILGSLTAAHAQTANGAAANNSLRDSGTVTKAQSNGNTFANLSDSIYSHPEMRSQLELSAEPSAGGLMLGGFLCVVSIWQARLRRTRF